MQILEAEQFEQLDFATLVARPFGAGASVTVEYLDAVSRKILGSTAVRQFPDLATFAFSCRRTSVERYLRRFRDLNHRFGLGAVVHVAPGNIPMNFAFSFAMGLLSGNQNYVRLPSAKFEQVEAALHVFHSVSQGFSSVDFPSRAMFFRSERDSPRFRDLVQRADGLIVWGGDETVAQIRTLPKNPLARELYFASRSSSAVIGAEAVLSLTEASLGKLVRGFFNDTYVVDQAACSSPSAVYWVGTESQASEASARFWDALEDFVRREWSSRAPTGVRKLNDLFSHVSNIKSSIDIRVKSNALWLTSDPRALNGPLRFGYFLERHAAKVADVIPQLRTNEQTITYFGVAGEQVLEAMREATAARVERICRVGRALDMGFIWDGKDSLPLMSRLVALD